MPAPPYRGPSRGPRPSRGPNRPDIDHPAVGAAHLFLPGSADSLVAAAFAMRASTTPTWVTLAREHRLSILLERPISEAAREVWCLGYAGTGNPLLPAAIEAHVTRRPFYWLSTTTGRLEVSARSVPGVSFESTPGGTLVSLVMQCLGPSGLPEARSYEHIGHLLARYPGVQPEGTELALVNKLHAAAVKVRNQERRGPDFVRELADGSPETWPKLRALEELAREGEWLIRKSRKAMLQHPRRHGGRTGAAVWLMPRGEVARGAHGKAVAARTYARKAPVALVERAPQGFTKAWVVLPEGDEERWLHIAPHFGRYGSDFSYTGLRGAGAIDAKDVERFAAELWELLKA